MTEQLPAGYVLDGEGRPQPVYDLMQWGWWYEQADRSVARDAVGEARVSTTFLGIDHGYGGLPLLYETMVFGGEHDGWQNRYACKEDAINGHRGVVETLKRGGPLD